MEVHLFKDSGVGLLKYPLLTGGGRVTCVHENSLLCRAAVHTAVTDRVIYALILSVLPQLVAPHAVAVVECDGAVVGDGVKADLFGVQRVAYADVLTPT